MQWLHYILAIADAESISEDSRTFIFIATPAIDGNIPT